MFRLYSLNRTLFVSFSFANIHALFFVVLMCTEFGQNIFSENAFSELGSIETPPDH